VFVTAYDQYALQAFEQAAVDYVLKPVQPERLAQTCAGCARHSRSARRRVVRPGWNRRFSQLRELLGTPGLGIASTSGPATRLSVIQAGVGAAIHMVPVQEVIYFEAADKYVRVAGRSTSSARRCANCCRSWTRTASGRCTAAPWCAPTPSRRPCATSQAS
jgi:DNA-binding LytR/AlgR family response regulator